MQTIEAIVLRNFKDAGTGRQFSKDDTATLDPGTFGNYRAAGLVSAAPAEKSAKPAAAEKPAKPAAA